MSDRKPSSHSRTCTRLWPWSADQPNLIVKSHSRTSTRLW
jgi:hypothetical protein